MLPNLLDTGRMAALVSSRRQLEKLSARQAAGQIGVSFSTVTRVERGEAPELQSLLLIAAWLEIPAAEFFVAKPCRPASTLEQIAYLLHADQRLPAGVGKKMTAAVAGMYDLFAVAE